MHSVLLTAAAERSPITGNSYHAGQIEIKFRFRTMSQDLDSVSRLQPSGDEVRVSQNTSHDCFIVDGHTVSVGHDRLRTTKASAHVPLLQENVTAAVDAVALIGRVHA